MLPHFMSGGGVPRPMSGGGRQWQVPPPRSRGFPIPGLGATRTHVWGGQVPPSQVWGVPHPMSGGYPDLEWGTPPSRPGMGYPPHLRWGTPPASVDRYTDWCQNITFPRTTYAGGNQRTIIGKTERQRVEQSLMYFNSEVLSRYNLFILDDKQKVCTLYPH